LLIQQIIWLTIKFHNRKLQNRIHRIHHLPFFVHSDLIWTSTKQKHDQITITEYSVIAQLVIMIFINGVAAIVKLEGRAKLHAKPCNCNVSTEYNTMVIFRFCWITH